MSFERVKYKRMDRNPVGCFDAHMTPTGWGQTKYVGTDKNVLLSKELTEFIRFVEFLFKECPDLNELGAFSVKYGTLTYGDEKGSQIYAINYIGDVMDYTVHIYDNTMNVFPYRKYRRDPKPKE